MLLRNASSSASAPGTTSALYVALSGPDAMSLWRVTLDAQGKELNRQNLYKWAGRQNPPGMQLRVQDGADGWKHVRVQVRGDVGAPPAPAGRGAGAAPAAPPAEKFADFGPAALRVNNGEIRIKDVLLTDLAPSGCRRRGRGDVAELPSDSADRPLLLRGHFGGRHQPRRQHGRAVGAARVSGTRLQARRRDLPAAGVRDRQPDVRWSVHRQLPQLRARLQRRRLA